MAKTDRWEYVIIGDLRTKARQEGFRTVTHMLDHMGERRWELVTVDKGVAFFKRLR